MTAAPAIHRAGPDDWSRVRGLRLDALRESPDAFWSSYDDDVTLSPSEWQERLASDDYAVFVADLNGDEVGLLGVGRTHHTEAPCGITMMWVAPHARGRGVGDALLAAAITWARDRGHGEVRLWVSDTNPSALALYERHGFRPTGVTGTYPPPRQHITEHERAREL